MHLIIIVCVYVYGFRLPTNQNMAATDMCPKLSCNICSNPFSDPRLLPCLHVFCKSCLETHQSQNQGTLTCPSCYKTTSCRPSQLPKHLRIEREVDLLKVQQSDNNKAEGYCEDCVSPICSDCVSSHQRLKPLKGHSIVSLDSAQPQSPPVTCNFHPNEDIKYYCCACKCLCCSDCAVLDHKDRSCKRIKEAVDEEKSELFSAMTKVDEMNPTIGAAIKATESFVKQVKDNKKRVIEEINESFDK